MKSFEENWLLSKEVRAQENQWSGLSVFKLGANWGSI